MHYEAQCITVMAMVLYITGISNLTQSLLYQLFYLSFVYKRQGITL